MPTTERAWEVVRVSRTLEEMAMEPAVWLDERVTLPRAWRAHCRARDAEVTLHVELLNGRLACVAIERASDSDPPLTGALLRTLKIDHLMRVSARFVMTKVHRSPGRLDFSLFGEVDPDIADRLLSEVQPRGRRSDEESHADLLARVVRRYRELADDPAPRQVIAAELGYSVGYVAQLLNEARKAKPALLGPARPGRPGEIHAPQQKRASRRGKNRGR